MIYYIKYFYYKIFKIRILNSFNPNFYKLPEHETINIFSSCFGMHIHFLRW